jgi:hypothetical protein
MLLKVNREQAAAKGFHKMPRCRGEIKERFSLAALHFNVSICGYITGKGPRLTRVKTIIKPKPNAPDIFAPGLGYRYGPVQGFALASFTMPKGKAIVWPGVFDNSKSYAIEPDKITGLELMHSFH